MIDLSDWTKSDIKQIHKAFDTLDWEQIDHLDDVHSLHVGALWCSRRVAHWMYVVAFDKGWIAGPA